MFDLRNVIENYVKADNMAANGSAYKTTTTSDSVRHPVHLIDKYSLNWVWVWVVCSDSFQSGSGRGGGGGGTL
jgi:hypothetical protein